MSHPGTDIAAFKQREWHRALGAAGLGGLIVLIALGLLHSQLAPYARDAVQNGLALVPPSGLHPFGTDLLGRDMLSETLHGLGTTLDNAGLGFIVALFAGNFAGLTVAHLFGRLGAPVRLAAAVLGSIPALLLAVLIAALFGHAHAAIAAGLAAAPAGFARSYDRARQLLALPHSDFARASGVGSFALLQRDLAYGMRESLVANAARALAAVTITLATMSFFGFGATPPARDLGLMIASARPMLPMGWWTALAPATALALLILSARLAAGLSGSERA